MIGEENFESVFPDVSGYQYFMAVDSDRNEEVASVRKPFG